MDFDIQIAHSVEEVGQEAWDNLGQGFPFASYRWYRFGERVLTDAAHLYIILSQRGQPMARCTLWLKTQEPLPIRPTVVRRLIEGFIKRRPLLVCRSPLTSISGLVLPHTPLSDKARTLIAQIALDEARQLDTSFLVFDYLKAQETSPADWPEPFSVVQVSDPGTHLSITWSDFDCYVSQLSKSARKDYRRHRNRATDLGIKIACRPLTNPLTEDTVSQAMTLIGNVDRHHGSPSHPYGREMLENAHTAESTWITAKIDGQLVGCGLALRDGEVQFLALLGLDYQVQYVYFQMIYAAIRSAIENDVKVLRGGSGTYSLKRRLGFEPEDNNYVTFAGRGALLQKLGRWAARLA